MRSLLKGYANRGGTVLLSSHLLNEVEQVADEMVLIGNGRIVAQGDKRSLLAMDTSESALVSSLDNRLSEVRSSRRDTRLFPKAAGSARAALPKRSDGWRSRPRSCSPNCARAPPGSRTYSPN